MNVMKHFSVAGLIATLLAGGCRAGGDRVGDQDLGWSGVIDTLPSGIVIVYNPVPRDTTDLRVVARVGQVAGPPQYQFGHVQALAVDRMGRVYIADDQAQVVRAYDSTGVFIRDLGGSGQGPGEFLNPTGLTWRNDSTLWILDFGNGRYSAFDTAGTYLVDVRRPALGVQWPWPGRFDHDRLIEPLIQFGAIPLVGFRVTEAGNALQPSDTFGDPVAGVLPQARAPFWIVYRGATASMRRVPYTVGYEWSLDGRGNVWVGHGDTYRIVRRQLTGDTTMIVEVAAPRIAVSAEERATAIETLGSAEAARSLDLSRIPTTKPAFRQLLPGPQGELWVLREGEGAAWFFDHLDSDGRLLRTWRLPAVPELAVRPVIGEKSIWIVTRDDLDMQTALRLSG